MNLWIAQKTLDAISYAIAQDGGNRFRWLEGQALPLMTDAYRSDEDGLRSHLGASKIGTLCERALWYSFRWFGKMKVNGKATESETTATARMLRLWNRGHIEEGRFLAMMWLIDCTIYQQDAEGKQFKISEYGGHFGGSGDGIAIGVPDLPQGIPCLTEYKTHNAKSFAKLIEVGVKEAKPEHYAQMQTYMFKFGLQYALYMAVNKDTDELHGEIVMLHPDTAKRQIDKAGRIIFAQSAPPRLRSASPGYYICKFCDVKDVCFGTVEPERNCRTCGHVRFTMQGSVICHRHGTYLNKEQQKAGCGDYKLQEHYR